MAEAIGVDDTLGNDIRQMEMTEWKYRQKTALYSEPRPTSGCWLFWFGVVCTARVVFAVVAYLVENLVDCGRSVYQAIK